MLWSNLSSFWLVSVLFVLIPGADWAYAIAAGIQGRVGRYAVGGLLIGHIAATLFVAAGLGLVVASSPQLMAAITFIGALYLGWLGISVIRNPPVPAAIESQGSRTPRAWLLGGIYVSGLNPKVILLLLALMPQFTDASSSWPIALQVLTLGAVHITSCALAYSAVTAIAHHVLSARPHAAQLVARISGVVLLFISILLMAHSLF